MKKSVTNVRTDKNKIAVEELDWKTIDDGIRGVLRVLRDAGVKTYSSCQGGRNHGYLRPTVCFEGNDTEGNRAQEIAEKAGYIVFQLSRTYLDGTPFNWQLEFVSGAASDCKAQEKIIEKQTKITNQKPIHMFHNKIHLKVIVGPELLSKSMTHDEAKPAIAGLKNWHGFDGFDYANEAELLKAIEDGTYTGGWLLPAKDILLEIAKHKELVDDLFKGVSGDDRWVVSSSEHPRYSSYVWHVRLTDGYAVWNTKDNNRSGVVPVRVVLDHSTI